MAKKVLVIGDTIIDEDINLQVIGLSLESPTFKTKIKSTDISYGGAANVAKYLCLFGVEVDFVTCMSKQNEIKFKKRYPVSVRNLDNSVENKKSRYYIHHGDSKYKHLQINDTNTTLKMPFPKSYDLNKYDIVAISDYRCGVVTNDTIKTVEKANSKTFAASQVSDKKSTLNNFNNFDYIVCNENESKTLTRTKNVIITKGSEGSELNGKLEKAFRVENVKSTIGAGDCFYAAYLAYEDLKKANEMAAKYVKGEI